MEITGANLQQFFQLIDFTFYNKFSSTPTFWNRYAQKVPSKTEKNVYPWLSETPSLREWLGPRVVQNLATRDYSLTNRKFESVIGLDKDKLADDTYGFFQGHTEMLAKRVAEFADENLTTTLEAGNTTICWDGQYFFDTDHPVNIDDSGKGQYINNLVGSAYDLSLDPKGVFRKVRAAMMKFKREDGKPLGLIGDTLMVPPDWEGYAKDAVEATFVAQLVNNGGTTVAAAGVSNVFQGVATVVVNPWLATTNAAYLFCTTRGIMPMLYQEREGANFVPRVDPASPNVFEQKRYEWGVDLRAAFGYTLPQLAIRFAAS